MTTQADGLRVLLVDDEPQVRAYMSTVLSKHGCQVIEAQDGVEACELLEARAGAFDVVITDIRMPRMDGVTLGNRVQACFPDIPVLYVSAYLSEVPVKLVAASRFIRKPFTPDTLLTRVWNLTKSAA